MTLTCVSSPSSFGPPLLGPWLTVTGPKAISPRETPTPRRPEECAPPKKEGSPASSHRLPWEAAPPMSSLQMAIKGKLFKESLKTSESSHDRVKNRMLASLNSVFPVI